MKSSATAGDLEFFQRKLLARETRLRRATVADPATADPDAHGAELERNRRELQEIDAALERIDAGTYGFCMRCAKPMDRARLELFPAARFDMCCMENEEIEHAEQHATLDRPVTGQRNDPPPP